MVVAWFDVFDFGKKIGYPELFSIGISFLAMVLAVLSYWNSYQARMASLPALSVDTTLEGYDTRAFSEGRLIWYWGLNLNNTGGRSLTLQAILPDNPSLPLVVLAKNYQFLELRPRLRTYVFDSPKFAEIGKGSSALEQYEPKDAEELGSVNLTIPSGESRAFQLAFAVDAPKDAADRLFFNLKLKFNTGMSYSLSKFVGISAARPR